MVALPKNYLIPSIPCLSLELLHTAFISDIIMLDAKKIDHAARLPDMTCRRCQPDLPQFCWGAMTCSYGGKCPSHVPAVKVSRLK